MFSFTKKEAVLASALLLSSAGASAGGWMLSYRWMAMDITWSAPCMLTLTAGWQYAF